MKFIVVTGGIMSGIGKGVTTSSIGVLLKNYGFNVTAIKIDPYLNIDAGTMSPYEHGECFVLEDGGEVDLDLGNYERFLDIRLTRDHNITTGKIYRGVIDRERKGEYLGKTVQMIPHVTNYIKEWISKVTKIRLNSLDPDICIIELGGTVGDIESMIYIEAIRQMSYELGTENILFIHLSYVPILKISDEEKTKPTQHSIQRLRSYGINPDILCVRCEKMLEENNLKKLANYCQTKYIIPLQDVSNIYRIPLVFDKYNIMEIIKEKLKLKPRNKGLLEKWKIFADKLDDKTNIKKIVIISKYIKLKDSYLSLMHAIRHAALHLNIYPEIKFIDACEIEADNQNLWQIIQESDGIIIPGAFGSRGAEGMLEVIKYARENSKSLLGICYGMQLQVVEALKNLAGIKDITSEEFMEKAVLNDSIFGVIRMDDLNQKEMGGTMRLGLWETYLEENTRARWIYGEKDVIKERHRHRYEINTNYIEELGKYNLKFSGKDRSGKRMEILELDDEKHPFFIGCQFHPEYNTYPERPHPLFVSFLKSM